MVRAHPRPQAPAVDCRLPTVDREGAMRFAFPASLLAPRPSHPELHVLHDCAALNLPYFAPMSLNKLKVLNDPVHGFIRIPDDLIFDIIQHPYFQRLRRIKQLGLSDYVYPGAQHTRFNHALGAFHLMQKAIQVLRFKGVEISHDEERAALIAILLHDIGHGPYSHTLENSLVNGISHERLSNLFMEALNDHFDGRLRLAIDIFQDRSERRFLHQLISGQLDMDRLDYLARDSYFTGVSEGIVNFNRIIDMLQVADDRLVVEQKAIYSIEKFLVSRRLMYWQVYLHKTAVCAEEMLVRTLRRARHLVDHGDDVAGSDDLLAFLRRTVTLDDLRQRDWLDRFARLDDIDLLWAVKQWQRHDDTVLARLSHALVQRRLFRIALYDEPVSASDEAVKRDAVADAWSLDTSDAAELVWSGTMTNYLYNPSKDGIGILMKDGTVTDIARANDQWTSEAFKRGVRKHFLIHPKGI